MVNTPAKFEVCVFSHSRDIRGSHNLKVNHVTQAKPSFDLFFNFLFSIPYDQCACKI